MTGSLSEASRDEIVTAQDKAYLLKYASEGTCYVQRNEDVFLANCPSDGFEAHERKPAAFEWWVLVKTDAGSGWLKVDDRVEVKTKSTM